MTPEAQRIAIAEACPDLFEIHQTWRGPEGGRFRTFLTKKGEGVIGEEIDPLSDLNAMHAAVLSQSVEFRVDFNNGLRELAIASNRLICDLTAKDWADVFIGLWE